MRISDWSSDVCSSDLAERRLATEPGTTLRFARGDIRDDRPDHEAATAHYVKHVYGKSELGGTQVRYLSGVAFAKLGLPTLGDFAPVRFVEALQIGRAHV